MKLYVVTKGGNLKQENGTEARFDHSTIGVYSSREKAEEKLREFIRMFEDTCTDPLRYMRENYLPDGNEENSFGVEYSGCLVRSYCEYVGVEADLEDDKPEVSGRYAFGEAEEKKA